MGDRGAGALNFLLRNAEEALNTQVSLGNALALTSGSKQPKFTDRDGRQLFAFVC